MARKILGWLMIVVVIVALMMLGAQKYGVDMTIKIWAAATAFTGLLALAAYLISDDRR